MRPAITQLRSWDLEQLRTASTALSRRLEEFDDLMDGVGRASATAAVTWHGSAATQARRRMDGELRAGRRLASTGLVVAEVLNTGIMAIEGLRRLVLDAADTIEMLGGRIGDDGEVVAGRLASPLAAGLAETVRSGLEQVDAADRTLAARLVEVLADLEPAARLRPQGFGIGGVLAAVGPAPADPAGLSSWWISLSDADKAAVLAERPELGTRPGMPAATRDFYNRDKLEELIAQAAAEGARTRLAGFETVAAELAKDPRALLLDVDRRGSAAIALNNPDTATHVTTLVPGTGTTLRGMGRDVDRTRRLLEAAEGVNPDNAYSVIAWDGYAAPPDFVQAADPGYAVRGGEQLREFQAGLAASHEVGDPYSVVIAHSYGTATTGVAASGGGTLAADALAFVGSPGAMVDDVRGLSLTGADPREIGDHVYSSKAAHDPIPLAANIGRVVDSAIDVLKPGLGAAGTAFDLFGDLVADRVSGPFGVDPTDAGKFGGRVFTSDPGTGTPLIGWNFAAHSESFDLVDGQPNRSLRNLALIMANQGGKVS